MKRFVRKTIKRRFIKSHICSSFISLIYLSIISLRNQQEVLRTSSDLNLNADPFSNPFHRPTLS